ncbi:T9SS type A sorting domain-containing protein [candidate division KSB1 bacterium]|nr:T9SS type A sorting domain-containing protein [candidate division KSB1 bacterium]
MIRLLIPAFLVASFTMLPAQDSTSIPLTRFQPTDLRILSYNVFLGGIADQARQSYFERIIKSLNPDILAIQEINSRQVNTARSNVASWLDDNNFTAVGLSGSNALVSRYPILNSAQFIDSGRCSVILLDTEAELGTKLLVINTHLAFSPEESRQVDADEIIMRLREWRNGTGPFELESNTPIVHVGDFNQRAPSPILTTLTEGDIIDEASFGTDFPPDWDGTPILDLNSIQNADTVNYTVSRGRMVKIDYVFYTDSAIEVGNHYVLNTRIMTGDDLTTYNLEAADTDSASDHLPTIMDIASILSVSVETISGIPAKFTLRAPYPNPFNPSTTIEYSVSQAVHVELTVYDLLGRQVSTLVNEPQAAGKYSIKFSAGGLASGVYFVRLTAGDFVESAKIILAR